MGNFDIIEDRENVQPSGGDYEPIPAGTYLAEVSNSEVKSNSKGDGVICKITHTILDGDYSGRLIFSNFNIVNSNEKAQQISRGQLSSLSRACGLPGIPSDSTELHGISHQIKVKIKKGTGDFPDRNEIANFLPLTRGEVDKKERTPTVGRAESSSIDDSLPDFMR